MALDLSPESAWRILQDLKEKTAIPSYVSKDFLREFREDESAPLGEGRRREEEKEEEGREGEIDCVQFVSL